MLAEYRRQREELGLAEDDGNNDRPPRPARWIESTTQPATTSA
jgi:hypothetical protein